MFRHGKGTLKTDEFVYDGNFVEDIFEGYAEVKWNDECRFKGIFEKGKMKSGIYYFASGNTYEGEFD